MLFPFIYFILNSFFFFNADAESISVLQWHSAKRSQTGFYSGWRS